MFLDSRAGGRNEAHHGGFTDDRAYFRADGLDPGSIFIFDVHGDAGKPKLVKTLTDFVTKERRDGRPAHPEAMKRFGNTVVVWSLHAHKPRKVLDVPGAPLEVRCAWQPNHDYCFTTSAVMRFGARSLYAKAPLAPSLAGR